MIIHKQLSLMFNLFHFALNISPQLTFCWSVTNTCIWLVSTDINHFFIGYSCVIPGYCGTYLLLWIVSHMLHGDVVDGVWNQIVLFCDSVRNNIIKSELNIMHAWLPN